MYYVGETTYVAPIGLGGNVDSQVRGDVVTLGEGGDGALVPLAGEAQVVVGLAADMLVPEMLVEHFSVVEVLEA